MIEVEADPFVPPGEAWLVDERRGIPNGGLLCRITGLGAEPGEQDRGDFIERARRMLEDRSSDGRYRP